MARQDLASNRFGPRWYRPDVPEIQGHRGARALRPENTLPGFAYALAIGVDALEFDVTLTADSELILAHDLTVDPQTIKSNETEILGKSWRSLTMNQIATLDAGGREPTTPYSETFVAVPGTAVPTLSQVCLFIKNHNEASAVALAVELKTDPAWEVADVTRLTGSALDTLAAHDLIGRSRILAFDWRVFGAVRLWRDSLGSVGSGGPAGVGSAGSAVPRVALIEPRTWQPGSSWLAGLDPADYGAPDPAGCVAAARDIGADWVSPDDRMVRPELIRAAHRDGLRVSVWTVNDPRRAAELTAMGVDGIVTDRPDLLAQLRGLHNPQRGRRCPQRARTGRAPFRAWLCTDITLSARACPQTAAGYAHGDTQVRRCTLPGRTVWKGTPEGRLGGLVDIRSGQMLAWDSKTAEGLNTSDVPMEFCLLQAGVAEAFDAWRTGRVEIGQELADAAVHLFALAQMTGIDLQDELEAKLPHAESSAA